VNEIIAPMTQQMPTKLGELANKFRSLDMNDLETKQWEHGAGLIKNPLQHPCRKPLALKPCVTRWTPEQAEMLANC
jgi:hypothetical protein